MWVKMSIQYTAPGFEPTTTPPRLSAHLLVYSWNHEVSLKIKMNTARNQFSEIGHEILLSLIKRGYKIIILNTQFPPNLVQHLNKESVNRERERARKQAFVRELICIKQP